jgi:hypothetical protein
MQDAKTAAIKIEVFTDPTGLLPEGAVAGRVATVGSLKFRWMTVGAEQAPRLVIEGPNGEYLRINGEVELSLT